MNKPFFLILFLAGLLMTFTTQASDRVLDIREYKTPKGITVWHVPDHSLPIITIDFAFRGAGAITDPQGKDGLGQLVSNTIDEGAGERDANAFQRDLQNHAIELHFRNSRDHFYGQLKTIKRHMHLAFAMTKDALTAPHFSDEALNRMRHANITRVRSSVANPEWLAARLMNDIYYGDHPYARNSGGTISGLNAVTAQDMHDFVKTYLTLDRLVVAVAGDIEADELAVHIDAIFGDLPQGSDGDMTVIGDVVPPSQPIERAFETNSPQSVVSMTWPTFPKSDPDYYALRVMNHLLGAGGFASYLMEEVREKRGLTYGIYSQLIAMQYANHLTIESAASPENIEPMQQAIQDVLMMLKTEITDAELLSDAKNYLIGSLPLQFSSTQSLSRTALNMQMDHMPIDYLDHWADNIRKVNAQHIQKIANRIFARDAAAVAIAGAVPENLNIEKISQIPGIE